MTNLLQIEDELKARGIVKVENVIAEKEVRLARDLVRKLAKAHGYLSPSGWKASEERFEIDQNFRKALKTLTTSDEFPNFINPELIALTEHLVGEPVTIMPPGQQILFSLPDAKEWGVPHDVWHVDTPRLGPLGAPGLQVFTFLDDVKPRAGGTLVVAGSHRLYDTSDRLRSRELKRRLSRTEFFSWLFDADRSAINAPEESAGSFDGINLQITELTGHIGDIYLMDLRALHAPAPNSSDQARIMITARLPRAAIADKLFNS